MFFSSRLLCFTLLLSAVVTASAQTLPTTITPSAPRATAAPASPSYFTRADTARAIRKLFRSRRGGGTGWLAFGTAGILAATLPAQQSTSAGVWTPGVVAGSAFMLIGLNKRVQFRAGRERRILRELAATGRIPTTVARRLRGKFSPERGAAFDYNPLLSKAISPNNSTILLTPAQMQETAHADTLRAISRLFERRRKGGKRWAYLGLSGALSMARVLTAPNANDGSTNAGGLALIAGVFVGVPIAVSIVNLTAYSEAHEEEVERIYRSGQPLPKIIRQRMKKKDLEPYD